MVRSPGALFGIVILTLIIGAAILAPWIAPYDPIETDLGSRLGAPRAEFLFGTDLHGRDVFSRVVWGARYSLPVGAAAARPCGTRWPMTRRPTCFS